MTELTPFQIMNYNTQKNLNQIIQTDSMSLFPKQKRVIVVAPGPSLKHFLEQYEPQPDDFILSTSRAARTLFERGLVPHAIIHIDYQEKYFSFIEDLDLSNTDLILCDAVDPKFFSKPCKKRWVYRNSLNPIMNKLVAMHQQFRSIPSVESVGSVSCDAVWLMISTNPKQIIIVGQDAAINQGLYFDKEKNPNYEIDQKSMVWVLGQDQASLIKSTYTYFRFGERLQIYAKTVGLVSDMEFINFSPGGMFLHGWKHVKNWDQIKN